MIESIGDAYYNHNMEKKYIKSIKESIQMSFFGLGIGVGRVWKVVT